MLLLKKIALNWEQESTWYQISLSVQKGDTVHIQGKNGVGKSTFLRVLAGSLPYSGTVSWCGIEQDLHAKDWRQDIFYLGDIPGTWYDKRVVDIIKHQKNIEAVRPENYNITSLLDELGLQNLGNKPWRMLSHGQKKKIMLAPCVGQKRSIWLLDEPYLGLDVHAVEWLTKYIKNHNAKGGIVLFSGQNAFGPTRQISLTREVV